MRKPAFCIYAKTKVQISCPVTAQLISAFVFATKIIQSLCFLNLKFQACSYLLKVYSLVCVRPGWKARRQFSHGLHEKTIFVTEKWFLIILCAFQRVSLKLKLELETAFYINLALKEF